MTQKEIIEKMAKEVANKLYDSIGISQTKYRIKEIGYIIDTHLFNQGIRSVEGFEIETYGEGPYSNPEHEIILKDFKE